jgi:ribosomal protein L29
VINRRQAVIGYVTYRLARRLARREAGRRLGGLRREPRADEGGLMFRNSKGTASAAADRAAALVETVRPIITKAMNDPELHEALRQAFATGRQVQGEISGKPPSKAAKKLAKDRRLQKRVEASATDLQKAVSGLVEQPRRKGRVRRAIARIAVMGAAAGAVVVVLRKVRGGGGGDSPA